MATHHPSTTSAITDIIQAHWVNSRVAILKYVSDKVHGIITINPIGIDSSHDTFESNVNDEKDLSKTPTHPANVTRLQSELTTIKSKVTPPLFKLERNTLEDELKDIYTDTTKSIIIASDPMLILQLINLQKDIESASPNLWTIWTKVLWDIIQGDNVMDIEITNPFGQECRVKDESGREYTLPRGTKNIQVPISWTSRIGNIVGSTLQFFDPNDHTNTILKQISSQVQEELLKLKTPDISHPTKVKMWGDCQLTFNNPVTWSRVIIKNSTGTAIQSFDGSASRNFEIDTRHLNTLWSNSFQAIMTDPKWRVTTSAPFDFNIWVEINDDILQIESSLEIENGQPINIPVRWSTRGAQISIMNGANDIADRALLSGVKNETVPLKTSWAWIIDSKKPGDYKIKVIISDPHTSKTHEQEVIVKIKEAPLKLSSSPQFSSNPTITKGESSVQVGLKWPVEKWAELILNGGWLSDFRYSVTSRISKGSEDLIDLDGINTTNSGPQTIRAYFRDPNTDKKSGNGGFTIQIKESLEHKDEPDFSITEYTPGGELPEVEIRNVPKNWTFEIDYPRSTGSTSIVRRNTGSSIKQKLQDFDESGTGVDITVNFKDSAWNVVSSATKRIKRNIAPPLEKPEGMPESVEITKDARRITLWKMKPGQNMPAVLSISWDWKTISVTPIKTTDGTYYFDLPKKYSDGSNVKSIKHTLNFDVTGGGHAPLWCSMDINVRIPPTKLEIIDTHHLEHAMTETLKTWRGSTYDMKWITPRLTIERYGVFKKGLKVQIPDIHGHVTPPDVLKWDNPKELLTKIQERLKGINDHNLYDYNVANGIVTEHAHAEHKKDWESHEKSDSHEASDKKGDEKKWDHKEGHPEEHHTEEGGTVYSKVVSKLFWNGLVGKMFKWPPYIRGVTGAAFDATVASTVVGGGLYLTSAAIGSVALSTLIVPAMTTAFAGYGIYSAVKRFNKWRASKWGGDSHGGGHGGH